MKTNLLAIAAFVAAVAVSPAHAGARGAPDHSVPAAGSPVAHNWAGLYGGVHAGYGWAFPDIASGANPPRPKGILGGVQAGYNWQWTTWVLGIDGDFTFSEVAGSSNNPVPGGTLIARGLPDKYATLAGRAGYAVDRSLFFVKAGPAWMSENFKQIATGGAFCTGTPCTVSNNTWGWTAGAGAEYAMTEKWSVKLEYSFLDFPKSERVAVSNGVSQNIFNITRTFDLLKVGVNYKF
jgi:outer membrane immunogenic protein